MAVLLILLNVSVHAATLESARSLAHSGRVIEALRELKELEQRNPNDPDLQFAIGETLQELAGAKTEQLQKLAPESAQMHELMGKLLESHQKEAEAALEYQLAAKREPNRPGIHFLIGNLFWKQRDLDAARPAFEKELELNPDHAQANLRMGEILLVTDRESPQSAIPYLHKAIADAHTGLEAHRELGKALRLAGRYGDSYHELEFVLKQDPDDELVHAQLAALYRDKGDSTNARKELAIQRQILQRKRDASLQVRDAEPKP